MVGTEAEERVTLVQRSERIRHTLVRVRRFQWSAPVRSGKTQFAFFAACRRHVRVFKASVLWEGFGVAQDM